MNFFTAAILAGAAQGLFLAIVLQVRESTRSPANSLLSALVALCALTNLDDFLVQSDGYRQFPAAAGFSLLLLPLIGPLIRFHVDALTIRGSWRFRRRQIRHAAVPIICWVVLVPMFTLSSEQRLLLVADRLAEPPVAAVVGLAAMLLITAVQIGICIFAALKLASRRMNGLDPATASRMPWIKIFLTIAAVAWASYALSIFGPIIWPKLAPAFGQWSNLVQVGALYALGFLGLTRPDKLLPQPSASAASRDEWESELRGNPKYVRSALTQEDAHRIVDKVKRALETEELFLDATLSLPKLGRAIGASTNDVSQAINLVAGTNFYGFINGYRIERAKRLLADRPEDNILDVAFAVGFNSKSVFNSAFKRLVGQTPSGWRDQLRA